MPVVTNCYCGTSVIESRVQAFTSKTPEKGVDEKGDKYMGRVKGSVHFFELGDDLVGLSPGLIVWLSREAAF